VNLLLEVEKPWWENLGGDRKIFPGVGNNLGGNIFAGKIWGIFTCCATDIVNKIMQNESQYIETIELQCNKS
jgi:hypothetical protein